jgi:hypothetical protein
MPTTNVFDCAIFAGSDAAAPDFAAWFDAVPSAASAPSAPPLELQAATPMAMSTATHASPAARRIRADDVFMKISNL